MSSHTKRTRSSRKKQDVEETPLPEPTPMPEPTPLPEPTQLPEETPMPEPTPLPEETPMAEETPMPSESKVEEPTDPVEKLQKQFEDLRALVSSEILTMSESDKPLKKTKVLTLLRKVNRQVNQLEKQTFRLVKNKKAVRKNKVVSGFQKPTRISKELAKFTNWSSNDLHSRVEVTKFICDYIKTNNLQNPTDRRQIIPDGKLQKLLGYNPKVETEPLRYYSIQFHLNKMKHFPKEQPAPTQA